MQPTDNALKLRQQQSRRYETTDEIALMSASVALLQDLGFNIDETNKELGTICASKARSAVNAGQQTAAIFVALLGGGVTPTDKEQKMRVGVVVKSAGDDRNCVIRATFQRTVWNTYNDVTRQELLCTDEIYTEFFDKLSKAVFLEAHQL
jgi:hypothetical protein